MLLAGSISLACCTVCSICVREVIRYVCIPTYMPICMHISTYTVAALEWFVLSVDSTLLVFLPCPGFLLRRARSLSC